MRPETVIIETENGPVMINKTDYDPNTHTLANAADMPLPIPTPVPADTVAPTATQVPAAVDANGNPVNVGDGGQLVPPALRQDGPTVEEYVAAGYDAANYPPTGYESRSTPEEIAAAQKPADSDQQPGSVDGSTDGGSGAGGGTTPPAANVGELFVIQSGKKHVVTDKDGNKVTNVDGIDAKGYATSAAAWEAVMKVKQGG